VETIFLFENLAVNEIMWKKYFCLKILPLMRECGNNILEPDRPQMAICGAAHAHCMLDN
jgi:hypothetical protein